PKQLAVTEKGDVYVVWMNNNSIYISSSHDDQKKLGSKIILSQVNKLGLSPQVFATEKGDVYVVWVDKNNKTGNRNITFMSSNDSGMRFDDRKKLRGAKPISFSPQLAATEKGDVYVVWVDKNNKTGDTDITFRSSNDSGLSFDDRKKLRRSESLLSFSPQLAATEKGDVYVVWVDKNTTTGDSDITFRRSSNSGNVFERVINLNKGENKLSNSSLPQVATTQKDSVYVVWLDNQIKFKEILVKDALVGNTISLSNKTTSSLSPQLTVIKNGNIFVIWGDKDRKSTRLNSSHDQI